MKELLRRLRFYLHRDRFEQDLDEEMQHHLSMQAEEWGNASVARRQFGNVTLWKEDSRAMWTWTIWEQLAQDLRYGLRTMKANPLFTAMAALSLALGIGANTSLYSFMDAILMRSLPVQRPEELVVINWHAKENPPVIRSSNGSRFRDAKMGAISPNFPYAAYEMLRTKQDTVSNLVAFANAWQVNLLARNQAEASTGLMVSGGFYSCLGVNPAAGRLITEDDDRAGAQPVAVISYLYWKRRFALDPSAVGESILINNIPFTIAGVSAPEFFGVNASNSPDVFIPLHLGPLIARDPARDEKERFYNKNFYWVEMIGRLANGVSMRQAEVALAAQFQQFALSTASNEKEKAVLPELWLQEGGGGQDSLRRKYSQPLYVLMGMTGLILLIACANIANLLLARATARRREMALRLSLGAGRLRVIRQLLTESVLLSLLGGVMGLIIAVWGIRSITWLLSNGKENFTLYATLNWQVLGFTLGLTILTGIVFGLAPALQATKVDLTPALKETRASAPRGRLRHSGFRIGLTHGLVVSQIAISLLLVIGAGLFVRTLANLNSIELGFNRENVLLFSLNARQAGYKEAALARFYDDLRPRFAAIPGVRSASASDFPLSSGYWNGTRLIIPGSPDPENKRDTATLSIDPQFFSTMQIPILLGRGFEERDMMSPKVAVVSEEFAQKFFANENPIGRRFGLGNNDRPPDIEIVGVAKTARYNSMKHENPPVAYIPYTQNLTNLNQLYFELRTVGDPMALINTVRQIVHDASASVPVSNPTTQSRQIDQTISQERTFAQLCSYFAGLALLIACVGLYGSMAYTVARRTSEIGIRMALGAERGRIVWMVVREVLVLGAVGIAIGLAGAYSTSRFVKSFLFGMQPNDPMAISISVAVLASAALIAGYAPARRASKIDPMVALRHE